MSLASRYFDQVINVAEGEKSRRNGTVLSKFFDPIKPTTITPNTDLKAAGDDLGRAVVKAFQDFERKNNVKFRFTRKQGAPMTATPTELDVREAARRVEQYEKDKELAAQYPALQEQNRIEGIKESARQSSAAAEANISTLLAIFKSHKERYHLALAEWLLTSDDIIKGGKELKQLYAELNGQYRQMIASQFVASEGPARDGFDARDRELRFGGQLQEAMQADEVTLDYPPTEGVQARLLAALGTAAPVRPTSPPKERARFGVVQHDGSVKVE